MALSSQLRSWAASVRSLAPAALAKCRSPYAAQRWLGHAPTLLRDLPGTFAEPDPPGSLVERRLAELIPAA